MAILSKAALLAATTLPRETVPTPEIEPGSTVIVQGLSAADRDAAIKATTRGKGRKMRTDVAALRLLLVSMCVVDEQGHRMLSEDDADELAKVRSDVIERIFIAAARLSGLNDEPMDEEDEEEAAKK